MKRHVGRVFQLRMEIQQPVVRINPFQRILNTEPFTADMLHQSVIVGMDSIYCTRRSYPMLPRRNVCHAADTIVLLD